MPAHKYIQQQCNVFNIAKRLLMKRQLVHLHLTFLVLSFCRLPAVHDSIRMEVWPAGKFLKRKSEGIIAYDYFKCILCFEFTN
jgi:hypothetical protein